MKKYLLLLSLFVFPVLFAAAQEVGDYRTTQSGDWNDINNWERFNGNIWQPATGIPDASAGDITILANNIITSTSDRVVDQLIIGVQGGLIITAGAFVVTDGLGVDAIVLGTLTMLGGTYGGSGLTLIDGGAAGMIWEAGTIGTNGTKITFSNGCTLDINGTGVKNLIAELVLEDAAAMNWNTGAGDINCNNADLINRRGLVTRGIINQYGDGKFINTGDPKTSTVTNEGPIHIAIGKSIRFTNPFIINLNQSSVFTGLGTFDISGGNDVFINTSIDIPGGFTYKSDGAPSSTQGTGSLTIKDNAFFLHNSGENKLPTTIEAGGRYELNTLAIKYLKSIITVKEGATFKWTGGSIAGLNAAINIEGTADILGGNKTLFAEPNSDNSINILPEGKLYYQGPGSLISFWNLNHNGESLTVDGGTVVLIKNWNNSGLVIVNGVNSFIVVDNIVNAGATATFNNGTAFSGDGKVDAYSGLVNVNAAVTIHDLFKFYLNGATAQGTGSLLVEGTFNYLKNDLNVTVVINNGGIANIYTADPKNFSSNFTINEGGICNVSGGDIKMNNARLDVYGTLRSVGTVAIRGVSGTNELYVAPEAKLEVDGPLAVGQGLEGNIHGYLDGYLSGNSELILYQLNLDTRNMKTGPGHSPGILTVNTVSPLFSNNSALNIEIQDGTGPGTGHDQLQRNGNLVLDGTLNILKTGTVPLGTYTIINLTSGTISGNFDVINLPPGYTTGQTSNTFFVTKNEDITWIFRSKQNGNWSDISTWELSTDGINWSNAPQAPSYYNTAMITIRSLHTVTVSSNTIVKKVVLESGAFLNVTAGTFFIFD